MNKYLELYNMESEDIDKRVDITLSEKDEFNAMMSLFKGLMIDEVHAIQIHQTEVFLPCFGLIGFGVLN